MLSFLKRFARGGVKSATLRPNEVAVYLTKPGDEWTDQARRMIGQPLICFRMDGCMAETEAELHRGTVERIERVPDGAAPGYRVIWVADGRTVERESFRVIVARCTWSAERAAWVERI